MKAEAPYCGKISVHHNTVWVHTSEHEVMATPGECAREIIKLRAKIKSLREMLLRRDDRMSEGDLDFLEKFLEKQYATATDEAEIGYSSLRSSQLARPRDR